MLTLDSVLSQLLKLKVNKGSGLDSIPASLLKDGAYEISEHLIYVINMSLTQEIVPDDFQRLQKKWYITSCISILLKIAFYLHINQAFERVFRLRLP